MTIQIAWVGLGSNLGDSAALLRSALRALHQLSETQVIAVSAFYRSPALTADPADPPQPDYCNAVAALRTELQATHLLKALLSIERDHGRMRQPGARWQARELDLDLLCLGEQVIAEPGLSVPHPQLQQRNFVLEPWQDIAAHARIPGQGEVTRCLAALSAPTLPVWPRSA